MAKRRITQAQLEMLFASPDELYEVLAERPGYRPKAPVTDGDCEFIATDVFSDGHLLTICMAHNERRAFVMLLSPDDIAAATAALTAAQQALTTSINLAGLIARPQSRI